MLGALAGRFFTCVAYFPLSSRIVTLIVGGKFPFSSITAERKEPWSRCWCQPCRRNVSEVCFDERRIGDGNLDAVVSITMALILICPHPAIFCAVPQVSVQQETAYRCSYFLETCNWTLRCPSHRIQDQEYFICRNCWHHVLACRVPSFGGTQSTF